MKIHDVLEGEITDIAFGGRGILRHEDRVIFVPFTAVGDKVSCQVTKIRKRFSEAKILRIYRYSSSRKTPECPYFGQCGGCQLQHLNYPRQIQVKEKFLKDAMDRIAKIPNVEIKKMLPSKEWSYRRHISLHFSFNPLLTLGFIAEDNCSTIDIDACLLFEKNDIIIQVRNLLKKLIINSPLSGKISIVKTEKDQYVLYLQFSFFPENIESTLHEMDKRGPFKGILASGQGKQLTVGNPDLFFCIDSFHFIYSPMAFVQNHPEQSAHIYKNICQIVEMGNNKKVLDLYCGIGVTSIILSALGTSVIGVESSNEAIRLAKINAKKNNVRTKFIQADVAKVIDSLLETSQPELVLMNPPRQGISHKVIQALLKYLPCEILYISCMPATLARDLRELSTHYRIVSCQPFDMFPQTTHLETLVHLKKIIT